MATSSVVENSLKSIFKRCVQCPPQAPQCPDCGPKVCILVPQDCNACAHMICKDEHNDLAPSAGPNVGAIAGGVVGGTALIVLIVFFVWVFWIKKRREQQDRELREEWEHDEIAHQKRSTRLHSIHDAASTRTRGSLANSILSRASNFIQIAYIPGVTNRNGSGRNSIHAPVPPIPAAHRQGQASPKSSPLSNDGDALFFGIDDLRGSTYSGTSSIRDTRYSSNRDTRYTMQSITPSLARESVASEVFWDDATTAPMPATAAIKLAPRMVSVKSATPSPNNSTPDSGSSPGTPPDYMSDHMKDIPIILPGQGSSLSVRGKATQVTLGGSNKNKGRFPVRQASDAGASSSSPLTLTLPNHIPLIPSPLSSQSAVNLSGDDARSRDSLVQNIDFFTPPAAPQSLESPFFDSTEAPSPPLSPASSPRPNPYASMASTVGAKRNHTERRYSSRRGGSKTNIGGLSAVIEEATRRASMSGSSKGEEGAEGPFGDEHRVDG